MRCNPVIVVPMLAALCACGPARPDPPQVPKVVYVTVEKIVKVPAKLTEPVPVPEKQSNTVGEAVRLANARKIAAMTCNGKLAEIAELGK